MKVERRSCKDCAPIFRSRFDFTKLIFLFVVFLVSTYTMAFPAIEFSPGSGGWYYNGAGILSFQQTIRVDRCFDNPADALVGALVHLPDFYVGGIPGGPYTLTPVTNVITITDVTNTITYLTGTLGTGDLVPVGTTAAAYSDYQIDIVNVTVNNPINSAALAFIASIDEPVLDFELSINGAVSRGFKWMLDNNRPGSDGFSGAMRLIPDAVIPEPATIVLLAISALTLLEKSPSRKRKIRSYYTGA